MTYGLARVRDWSV